MQVHTRIYMKHFGYGEGDYVPCEACGSPSVDVHHIYGRGKGKDVITNLMALCRKHHNDAHSIHNKETMQTIHNYFLAGQRKVFLK